MHQAVSQFSIGGEQQQAAGINVQTPYRDPAGAAQARQAIEYRWTAFRIASGAEFALRLVIGKHAAYFRRRLGDRDQMAVDADFQGFIVFNAVAQRGEFAVDTDATSGDFCFDFTTGTVACTCQDFL